MAQRRELVVCNTWYRKKEEHIITYEVWLKSIGTNLIDCATG